MQRLLYYLHSELSVFEAFILNLFVYLFACMPNAYMSSFTTDSIQNGEFLHYLRDYGKITL